MIAVYPLPVCHPAMKAANGDYYLLGNATTDRGALRCARKVDKRIKKMRIRKIPGNRKVWMPA